LSYIDRGIATAKRNAFWEVHDHVPDECLAAGCDYCESGWAHGPGLVYRCQCNPGVPDIINTEPYATVNRRPSLGERTVALCIFLGLALLALLAVRWMIADFTALVNATKV
jgi:hypothetical protein